MYAIYFRDYEKNPAPFDNSPRPPAKVWARPESWREMQDAIVEFLITRANKRGNPQGNKFTFFELWVDTQDSGREVRRVFDLSLDIA